MSHTIRLGESGNVQVTEEIVDTRPPDRIGFAAEGVITITETLLNQFEGSTLNPVRVEISVDDSRAVDLDLTETASLRLETVDVGVETPDTDDLSPGLDTVRSSGDEAESTGSKPGALAFTVEGAITDVPAETLETVGDGSPTLESITFAVEEPLRSDGGPDDAADVIFEFSLLGYGIAVHRNGVIDVGARGGVIDVELP